MVDAFLHTPWLGGDDPADPRGDQVDWHGDPRLRRVMHTFHHTDADGRPVERLDAGRLLAAMDEAGTERAVLPAKVYYSATEAGAARSTGRSPRWPRPRTVASLRRRRDHRRHRPPEELIPQELIPATRTHGPTKEPPR